MRFNRVLPVMTMILLAYLPCPAQDSIDSVQFGEDADYELVEDIEDLSSELEIDRLGDECGFNHRKIDRGNAGGTHRVSPQSAIEPRSLQDKGVWVKITHVGTGLGAIQDLVIDATPLGRSGEASGTP